MTHQNDQKITDHNRTEQELLDQLMLTWRTLNLAQKQIVVATANTLAVVDSSGAVKQ